MTITALDFETANCSDASICAAGLAVFEDGKLVESLYWLIRPPKGHGWFRFTHVHGLTWFDVQDAPEFPAIAPQLLDRLTCADLVVTHNASFDLRKLRGTLVHFDLPCPVFPVLCTLQLSRKIWPNLPSYCLKALADHIGRDFEHHNARADAEAAGFVYFAMMKRTSLPVEAGPDAGMPQTILASMGSKLLETP